MELVLSIMKHNTLKIFLSLACVISLLFSNVPASVYATVCSETESSCEMECCKDTCCSEDFSEGSSVKGTANCCEIVQKSDSEVMFISGSQKPSEALYSCGCVSQSYAPATAQKSRQILFAEHNPTYTFLELRNIRL